MAQIIEFPTQKARQSGINCGATEDGKYDCSISEVCRSRGACFKRELKAELEQERSGSPAVITMKQKR